LVGEGPQEEEPATRDGQLEFCCLEGGGNCCAEKLESDHKIKIRKDSNQNLNAQCLLMSRIHKQCTYYPDKRTSTYFQTPKKNTDAIII